MDQVLFEERNLERSMDCLLTALKNKQEAFGEKHSEEAETLYTIGRTLQNIEEFVDVLERYNISLNIQRIVHVSLHSATLKTLYNIYRIIQMCGEHFKSLEACTEAVQYGQKIICETHSFVLEMLILQVTVLHEMGRNDNAVSEFERAEITIWHNTIKAWRLIDWLQNITNTHYSIRSSSCLMQ